jgi:hypothetical protein
MTEETLNKIRPYLWGIAAILLGFEAFRCTKDAMDMARQGLYWHAGYWAPCSFPLYLLLEVVCSKSRKALVGSIALMALELCYILSLIDYSLSGVCLFLVPGMIVLLIYEDNQYLKLMNLITSVMMFLGLFRVSR